MEEEYKVLRDEMNQYYQNIANYNIALYTGSSAVFALVVDKTDFYYSLVPLMIIIPLFLLCENEHRKACKLGAYLNVYCEGTDFHWEMRHHKLDTKEGVGKRDFREWFPYLALSIVSCTASFFKRYSENADLKDWHLAIPVLLLLLCFVIIIITKVNYPSIRQKYIDEWEDLKSNNPNL